MAHVPLVPIGSRREHCSDERTFEENLKSHTRLDSQLARRRREVHAGWGTKYADRVHARGKLTARERLATLLDPGTRDYEMGTFVNYNVEFGGKALTCPGAGVITTFGRVQGRWCMIIANDNTVASGSWWPLTPEKIERAQTMALRLRLPTIYLVDCSGLFLPEQSRSFPGPTGAGHIFKKNSELSAAGVPQLAGVFGDCIAGGGYMPIISDRVYMTEQAYMVIAGAALIKGAKSQKITSLDIGGPEVHVHVSACADARVPDDETLIAALRAEVDRLPSSGSDYYRAGRSAIDPTYDTSEISGIMPADQRVSYDASEILARLCDQSLFWELMPHTGREMIVGVGRVGGLYAGFVINRQGLIDDPLRPGTPKPAGILYREGIAKVSAFSRACNDDGIPLIWLQDVAGFDVGSEAENQGLLGFGSSLIYSNSTNEVPMFTVLLRKASGAGYYALAGMPYDPVVQLSTCIARQSVMEGRTLAVATYNTKLDDNFEIVTDDPQTRESIVRGMNQVASKIEADMDPYVSARQMDTDEIVCLSELRAYLSALVDMSYQGIGYRRVKNPRIWSLHDLHLLSGGGHAAHAKQGANGGRSGAREGERADARQRHTATSTGFVAGIETADEASTDETCVAVTSPGVGIWCNAPLPGTYLPRGSSLGLLEVLGRSFTLELPPDVGGIVIDHGANLTGRSPVARENVDFGCVLLRLRASTPSLDVGPNKEATEDEDEDEDAAALVFRSPSAGRLHRRPHPDSPPYVEEGGSVRRGDTVALIEVMKTFTRIIYQGNGLPERASIVRVLVDDDADVQTGAVILELRDLGDLA
ncbi:MAG: carboxyl transferase domain-containing protein [Nannocystaceae bacterium]